MHVNYVILIAKHAMVLKKAHAKNVMMAGYFTYTVGVISVCNSVHRGQIK